MRILLKTNHKNRVVKYSVQKLLSDQSENENVELKNPADKYALSSLYYYPSLYSGTFGMIKVRYCVEHDYYR